VRIAAERDVGIEDFTEGVFDKGDKETRRRNLLKNGATEEAAEFLLDRCVELNALRSDELVAFVERQLQANGVRKLVPPQDLLTNAFRMFKRGVQVRQLAAPIAKGDRLEFQSLRPSFHRSCRLLSAS
jgi:hypothetical protein